MPRARTLTLILLAGLLVFDGSGRDPSGRHAGDGVGAGPTLTFERAESRLRELNPVLTDLQIRRIASAIMTYSDKYTLDPALVLAVIEQESTARPWARSPKGAIGLMQVMPYMMATLDIAGNPMSIETNIEAGCLILADNIRRLGEERGILSYFWGNEIRGVSYLERVQEARAALRRVES